MEVMQLKEAAVVEEREVLFTREQMAKVFKSCESGTVELPRGVTREERRAWLKARQDARNAS